MSQSVSQTMNSLLSQIMSQKSLQKLSQMLPQGMSHAMSTAMSQMLSNKYVKLAAYHVCGHVISNGIIMYLGYDITETEKINIYILGVITTLAIVDSQHNKVEQQAISSTDEIPTTEAMADIIDTSEIHTTDLIAEKMENEPLMEEPENQFAFFPITQPDIYQMYKKQLACFWTKDEIDMSKDYKDFNTLTKNEQHFIESILAFFAASDFIVNINLTDRFSNDVKINEAIVTYQFQTAMENIHSETYGELIETYIKDPVKKSNMLNAVETIPCIKKKKEWAFKWINSDDRFAKRLIAFAIVEGIFFSGSFCAIFWLKNRGGLMPGLITANEFISRDEGMHCDFACLLYSKIVNRIDQEEITKIFIDAVNIEKEFIIESIPSALIGINADSMSEYIEFVADRLMVQLGYQKIYNTNNPFPFMDAISVENKSNFFETRVSAYQRAGVLNDTETGTFEFTDEF